MDAITTVGPVETVPSDAEVLESIEAFLRDTGMKHSRFGRDALGEASFVKTLREGRQLTLATAGRVLAFIAERREAADHAAADTTAAAALSAGKGEGISPVTANA